MRAPSQIEARLEFHDHPRGQAELVVMLFFGVLFVASAALALEIMGTGDGFRDWELTSRQKRWFWSFWAVVFAVLSAMGGWIPLRSAAGGANLVVTEQVAVAPAIGLAEKRNIPLRQVQKVGRVNIRGMEIANSAWPGGSASVLRQFCDGPEAFETILHEIDIR